MTGFDLGTVGAAVRARAAGWERAGVRWSLTEGPVVAVTGEDSRARAGLTVGADGEATITVVSRTDRLTARYHYRLTNTDDLDGCLDEFTRHLVP